MAAGEVTPEWLVDMGQASSARVYNALLGGKDNFETDREQVRALVPMVPAVASWARQNRAFVGRAVAWLAAEAGVRQFLDLGCGITPHDGTKVHEIAQAALPGARVVYVDNDPIAVVHGRAYLNGPHSMMVDADLQRPEWVLESPEVQTLIDVGEPVALLLTSVLHLIRDTAAVWELVDTYVEWLPPGSALVISHVEATPATLEAAELYTAAPATPRIHQEIESMFDRVELLDPGLVPLPLWRPDGAVDDDAEQVPWLAGVGRKP